MKENAKLGVLVVLIGLKMTQHVKVILIIVCDVLLFSSIVITMLHTLFVQQCVFSQSKVVQLKNCKATECSSHTCKLP